MPSILLAVGNTAAASADIVLADGDIANIFVDIPATYNSPEEKAALEVQIKRVDNSYVTLGILSTELKQRSVKLTDAGTYRINRAAQANSIGAQRG